MQPPRPRRPRYRRSGARLALLATINLGALVVTVLVLRLVLRATGVSTETGARSYFERLSGLLTWPLDQLGPFQQTIVGRATLSDLATLLIIIVMWLALAGIIAGWEAEGRRGA